MFLILCVILISLLIFYITTIFTYWKRKNVPYIKPNFPFGNIKSVIFRERSFGLGIYDLYKKSNDPFTGIYLLFRPALLIRDPELVKNILTQDFQNFHGRGVYIDEKNDPMSATLFSLSGVKWKSLRNKLTPAFTSGRLKEMFPTILEVGEKLQCLLNTSVKGNDIIDVKDIFSRYTLDIIASVIFGLNLSVIDEPDHNFRLMSKKLTNPDFFQALRTAGVFLCPKLIKLCRMKGLPSFIRNRMIDMVKTTIEYREKHNIVRKDIMQILLQLRNGIISTSDDNWEFKTKDNEHKTMSIEECAGEAFVFYIAGSETSAGLMSFCMFELGRNEILMKRAQDEVRNILNKYNGMITYTGIQEMEFLDLCVKETMRKYPFPILNRECTRDYKIPNSNVTIEKGTAIVISLYGIHNDTKYFDNPDKFNPDRFNEENVNSNYFPFGGGPRTCIAFRMGTLVAKIGLVMMLKNFNFVSNNKEEIIFDSGTVPLIAKGGIPMKISPITK